MGKPLSQAKGEVNGLKERTNAFLDMAASALETETFADSNGIAKQIVKEPVGVVLSIAPWNYPLLTSVNSGAFRVRFAKPACLPRCPCSSQSFLLCWLETL